MDEKNKNNDNLENDLNQNMVNNQDNPYYNPYFNTDINSTSYYTDPFTQNDNNVSVDNTINGDLNLFALEGEENVNLNNLNTDNLVNNNYQNVENNANNEVNYNAPNLFDYEQNNNQNSDFNNYVQQETSQNFEQNLQRPVNQILSNSTYDVNNNLVNENNNQQSSNYNVVDNNYNEVNDNIYNQSNNFNTFNNENNNLDNINNFNINEPNMQINNYYGEENDEEFKRNWMGTLYEKANKRKFSIPSFFFGGYYYLYRKLNLAGIIIIVISMVVPLLLGLPSILKNTGIENIGTSILLMLTVPIILNILYGFVFYPLYNIDVSSKLKKYKNIAQTPQQLLEIAKNKGGTSIVAVILSYVFSGIIFGVLMSMGLASIMGEVVDKLPNSNKNDIINNEMMNDTINEYEPLPSMEKFNFYKEYSITYDSTKWAMEENSLVNGNYKLVFAQALEGLKDVGYAINDASGRSSFLNFLNTQFTEQSGETATVELGGSTFVYDNGVYYTYLDLVYSTNIERCYFILLPEKDMFIEFILSNTDTVIPEDINEEIIEYIVGIYSIEEAEQPEETIENSINIDIINGLSDNENIVNIIQNDIE